VEMDRPSSGRAEIEGVDSREEMKEIFGYN
jgi:hypothetical protein